MPDFFTALDTNIQIIIIYLLIINLLTYVTFGIDKLQSKSQKQRVSERTLWLLSLLGGTPLALIAMNQFRHKTKKLSFQAGMAVVLVIQGGLLYFFIYN